MSLTIFYPVSCNVLRLI